MNLFNKLQVVFLLMVFNLFAVMTKTSASTQMELTYTSCPTTLLIAILEDDYETVELLLKYGADPNASVRNCQFEVEGRQFRIMVTGENQGYYVDAFRISWLYRNWLVDRWSRLERALEDLPEDSLLLHIAALYQLYIHDSFGSVPTMYRLLVDYGADENAMDAQSAHQGILWRVGRDIQI